jgi:hypothetical protein
VPRGGAAIVTAGSGVVFAERFRDALAIVLGFAAYVAGLAWLPLIADPNMAYAEMNLLMILASAGLPWQSPNLLKGRHGCGCNGEHRQSRVGLPTLASGGLIVRGPANSGIKTGRHRFVDERVALAKGPNGRRS